jgi:hypothetical protein
MREACAAGTGAARHIDRQGHHGLARRPERGLPLRRGITDKAPHTPEEWKEARRRAVQLLEAPNLLIMRGRTAARPGERSENPSIELQPEEIQKLIDADHPAFVTRARQLQDAAQAALQSIDAKDAKGLFDAAGKLDKACENCHLHYWYPNDQRAQAAFRESQK